MYWELITYAPKKALFESMIFGIFPFGGICDGSPGNFHPNCNQLGPHRGCLLYFRLLTALAEVQGELEEEEKMMMK